AGPVPEGGRLLERDRADDELVHGTDMDFPLVHARCRAAQRELEVRCRVEAALHLVPCAPTWCMGDAGGQGAAETPLIGAAGVGVRVHDQRHPDGPEHEPEHYSAREKRYVLVIHAVPDTHASTPPGRNVTGSQLCGTGL